MISFIKPIGTLLFIVLFSLSLSACNTIAGIGEDIGAAGSKIEKTAKKNKKY